MMARLTRRAEQLARAEQRRAIVRVAALAQERLRSASVQITENRVTVTGRRLAQKWLADPLLRFMRSGVQ